MKKKGRCLVNVLLLGAAILSPPGFRAGGSKSLSILLPQSGEVSGWERQDDFQEYEGDDLFFYIDGGAEIYHEYGFERVIVQDYQNKNGNSASLEIYEMKDPSSAYGIYTFKTTGEGRQLSIGEGGKLQDYYLNIWKGKFLITLTGFNEEQETLDGLQAIAKAIDAKINLEKPSDRPALTHLLPEDGLNPEEVRYFLGNLGLFNSYPFTTKNLFQVKETVKGSYSSGYDIYIIRYENDSQAKSTFQSASGGLSLETRYKSAGTDADSIRLIDEKDTTILIKPFEKYIIIILGAADFENAAEIAHRARQYIGNQ